MSAGFRAALTLALALGLATGAACALPAADADHSQVTDPGNATTTIVVQLQPDGDARWTISARFNLTTDAEREAFEQVATAFKDGDTSRLGLSAYRQASRQASDATGRTMEITNVETSTASNSTIANGTGRLSVSFTWTNFARVEGDRVHVGDVFDTPGGTWFPGLEPGQTLVVTAPPQYSVFTANVAPENGSLRWTGPTTFGADSLSATFTGSPDSTGTPGEGDGPGAGLWVLIGTTGVGLGVVVIYLITRREAGLDLPPSPASSEPAEEEADATAETPESAVEPEVEPEPDAETEGKTAEDDSETDLELLSDEERVERLLEQNGGRMKQATIVKETGWSNAKVSQLLSSMEEDDRIDKLRIGRENLISFPDEDVTDVED